MLEQVSWPVEYSTPGKGEHTVRGYILASVREPTEERSVQAASLLWACTVTVCVGLQPYLVIRVCSKYVVSISAGAHRLVQQVKYKSMV